jgi:hypothetical protein
MSSFWNRKTGGNEDKQVPLSAEATVQSTTVATGAVQSGYGVAQANDLMSTLATGADADLVVHVIRRTLESVGVQVGALIAEAKNREGELRTQIDHRRGKIEELERQIDAERHAITGLESELALTNRTRDGLERSEARGWQAAPSAPPIARPPTPERGSRDSDRPTVMAVAKGLGEVVLDDGDVESILPDEPPSSPNPTGTK